MKVTKTCRGLLLLGLMVSVLCLCVSISSATAESAYQPLVTTIGGSNRYETAVKASQAAYPEGTEYVILATGCNWPDALGGSSLAGLLQAPILLSETGTLPAVTLAEIKRLGATRVVILGGEAAVGAHVADTIVRAGIAVERIAGEDRYATADLVARRVVGELGDEFDGKAFVATGANFPDALAVAPMTSANMWPIYLCRPGGILPTSTIDAMAGVNDVVVLGGPAAVSVSAESQLEQLYGPGNVARLAGATRYETAVRAAGYAVARAGLGWDCAGVATGENFPDALAGGVLQGQIGCVMVLTRTNSLPDQMRVVLEDNKGHVFEVIYYGGEGSVGASTRAAVEKSVLDLPDLSPVVFADPKFEAAVRTQLMKPVGDITVYDMESMDELVAADRSIVSLSGIEHARHLQVLGLSGNRISDLTPLVDLPELAVLRLDNNQVSDVRPLSGLTTLQSLALDRNQISDLTPLKGLVYLTSLTLWDNRVADVTPLAEMSDLRLLHLDVNQVTDISAISDMPDLTRLSIYANQVSDITPLSRLTNLSFLSIFDNQVADIAPLGGLPRLSTLELNRNQVSDISPLVGNPGIGAGDGIFLADNLLDLTPGSDDMLDIAALKARGARVYYE